MNINIVPFKAEYARVFKELNEEWITEYFEMEKSDHEALNQPEKHIIEKGGYIFVALNDDKPVGACALLKMNDRQYDFELAKMAVSKKARGKGIGRMLGEAVIEKAKSQGAGKIYLESNTLLKPAILLYKKLGFKKVTGHATPYKRCNIQMELEIV